MGPIEGLEMSFVTVTEAGNAVKAVREVWRGLAAEATQTGAWPFS